MANTYEEIRTYITENQESPEGYYQLGEYLSGKNPQQAYLCFENAYFYSSCKEQAYADAMKEMAQRGGRVPKTAMVILSYNNRPLTQQCIESIRRTTPESAREIIMIDNASADDSVEYLREQKDIILIENEVNEGFTKGCNLGIEAADSESDILLLNNDTVLMNNTLFWLRMGLYENDLIGAAGSVANKAWRQWSGEREGDMEYFIRHASEVNVPMENPLEYRTWLVGFCMLIKRTVLNQTGVLDELYSPGNGEDLDICLRILLKGYFNVLVKNSYIVHLEHVSFSKRADYGRLLSVASEKQKKKFGFQVDAERYLYPSFCSELFEKYAVGAEKVLVMNCSMGADVYSIAGNHPNIYIEGIDRDPQTAQFRITNSNVKMSTYGDIKYTVVDEKFDCIIFNTESVTMDEIDDYMDFCSKHLLPNGKLIVSVINTKHFSNWCDVVLNGKNKNKIADNVVTMEHFNGAAKRVHMHSTLWYFAFSEPGQDETGKKVRELLDKMTEGSAKKPRT